MQRLSSGLRINNASDDVAGLAIAASLQADSRLWITASRNINDGISTLNIMSSALDEQKSILIRLQELAEQSANGVYSDDQREAIQTEYTALVEEFGRIGQSTEFNGRALMLGSRSAQSEQIMLQVGITGDNASTISLQNTDTGPISGSLNVTELLWQQDDGLGGFDFWNKYKFQTLQWTLEEIYQNAGDVALQVEGTDGGGNARDILLVPLSQSKESDGIYFVGFVRSDSDPDIWETVIDLTDLNTWDAKSTGSMNIAYSSDGQVTSNGLSNQTIYGASTGEVDLDGLTISGLTSASGSTSSLEFTRVDSQEFARTALEVVGNRLAELSSAQGDIGALQSRLQIVNDVALSLWESLRGAESRIMDADIAAESAEMVRAQISQQAAIAVLAQANQQPALVLQLVKSS